LDALVFERVGMPMPEKFASLDLPSDSWQPANKYGGYFLEGVGIDHPLFDVHYQCPPYTQSLDAAIALCERKTETREQFVGVFDKGVDLWLISGDEDHRTMPKYAVLALLRALSTEDGK